MIAGVSRSTGITIPRNGIRIPGRTMAGAAISPPINPRLLSPFCVILHFVLSGKINDFNGMW